MLMSVSVDRVRVCGVFLLLDVIGTFDDRNRRNIRVGLRDTKFSELERKKKKPQKVLNRVSSSFTSALPSCFFFFFFLSN